MVCQYCHVKQEITKLNLLYLNGYEHVRENFLDS